MDIVYLVVKLIVKYRKEVGIKWWLFVFVLVLLLCGLYIYLLLMFECDEYDVVLIIQIVVNVNRVCFLEDFFINIQCKFGYLNLVMLFEDFDIVGESFDYRFLW